MHQVKLSLNESQVEFLRRHRAFGFRDRSELVRKALEHFQQDMERQELEDSAWLYAQFYDQDSAAKEWVESCVEDWPV